MSGRCRAVALGVALGMLVGGAASANPTGAQVVRGAAGFASPVPNVLQVTNTPGAIINWQRFSIGAGEITRFAQQSAASAVLNRVVGGNPSAILGQLLSNGRVYLINPQGIVFGSGAVVNTAGFVASTLNMTDEDFLSGKLRFSAGPGAGAIRNQGLIRSGAGGEVILIAPDIENGGVIQANGGRLILAAGRKVTLTSLDLDGVAFEVQAPEDQALNLGKLIADGGAVGVFAGTVRNRGVVQADSIGVDAAGRVVLSAGGDLNLEQGGRVSASGGSGGSVRVESAAGTTLVAGEVKATGSAGRGGEVAVLGNRVGLQDGARVDVSGSAGGGSAHIGGGARGEDPAFANAQGTYVAPAAVVAADATDRGDGGVVVVWADDTTQVYGAVSARGGAAGGDGGFVETSAKAYLDVNRAADVRAPAGTSGTWLLDPADLEVVAGGANTGNLGAPFFHPLAETSTIGADLINSQLNYGSNVVLDTTGQGLPSPGTATGNLTVSAPITKSASGLGIGSTSLTLRAHNDVVVNAPITSTGDPLSVSLTADRDLNGSGSVMINAPITTNGGSASVTAGGSVNLAGGSGINAGTGSVSITSRSPATIALAGGSKVSGGYVSFTSDSMHIDGSIAAAFNVSLQPFTTGRPLSLGAETAGSLSLTAAELARVSTPFTLSLGNFNDAMTIAGPVSSGAQSLNLSGSSITQSSGASISASGSIYLSASGNLTLGAPVTAAGNGSITLQGSGASINGPVTGAGTGPIRIYANSLTVGAAVASTGGGNISVAPQSFINMDLGTKSGGTLGLTSAEIDRFSTGGTLSLGLFDTGLITLSAPLAPAGVTKLALQSYYDIVQNGGATLTVSELNADSYYGTVSMNEANRVGTLSGYSYYGDFSFRNDVPLTVGSAAGSSGLSADSVTLDAAGLTLASTVSATTATLKSSSSATVSLGGADGSGVLGLDGSDFAHLFATDILIGSDAFNVPGAVSVNGNLTLAPATPSTAINIVASKSGGALELTPGEINNITAPLLTIGGTGAGPLTLSAAVTHGGNLTLAAPGMQLSADVTASGGHDLGITADSLTVGMATLAGNTVTLQPLTPGTPVDFGGAGSMSGALVVPVSLLSQISANRLVVGGANAGLLDVTDIISLGGGGLTLQGSNISQGTGATISAPSDIEFIAGGTVATGDSITSANGHVSFNGGTVSLGGPVTASSEIFITVNMLDVGMNATVSTGTSGADISIMPRDYGDIFLGSVPVGSLGLTAAGLDQFGTTGVLRIGDFNNTGNITVNAPIAPANAATLSLLATGDISQTAGSTISVPRLNVATDFGSVSLPEANLVDEVAGYAYYGSPFVFSSANALDVTDVDSVFGIMADSITLDADNLTVSDSVQGFSSVTLAPRSAGTVVDVGGADGPGVLGLDGSDFSNIYTGSLRIRGDGIDVSQSVSPGVSQLTLDVLTPGTGVDLGSKPGGTLGLTGTELNRLSLGGGTLTVGSPQAGGLTVSGAVNFTGASNLTLITGAGNTASIDSTLDVAGTLAVNADDVIVNAAVSAQNVTYGPVSANTAIDVDPGAIDNLTATNLSIGNDQTGAITLAGALDASNVHSTNLALTGGSIDLTGTPITVPGSVSLTADDMNILAAVTSSGGGTITVAPRTYFRGVSLGTESPGNLSLQDAELKQFMTTGALRVGDALNTGPITVTADIAPTGAGSLALLSRSSIGQSGGVITASGLRLQSSSSISLSGSNSVGTLSGSSSGSFLFADAAPLSVATVDGQSGISDNSVTLRVDNLDIAALISSSGTTLVPLTAGRGITLGAEVGGTLSLTDAELQRISAFTLSLGDANSGPITVAGAASPRPSSSLLLTSPAGTVRVTGALTVPGSISVVSDGISIGAPVTSSFGSVTLRPYTAATPVVLGAKSTGSLGLTAGEIGLISVSPSGTLTIGSTSAGPLSVVAPLAPAGVLRMTLQSGGGITQSPGADISVPVLALSSLGRVDVTQSNHVLGLSGFVSGSMLDFLFNSAEAMRLQDISVSNSTGGLTLITSGSPVFLGSSFEQLLLLALNQVISQLDPEEQDEDGKRLREKDTEARQEEEQKEQLELCR